MRFRIIAGRLVEGGQTYAPHGNKEGLPSVVDS